MFTQAIATDYITEYTREEALFYVAKMYFLGQHVTQSISKAKSLFEQANKDMDHEDIAAFCTAHAALLGVAGAAGTDP